MLSNGPSSSAVFWTTVLVQPVLLLKQPLALPMATAMLVQLVKLMLKMQPAMAAAAPPRWRGNRKRAFCPWTPRGLTRTFRFRQAATGAR